MTEIITWLNLKLQGTVLRGDAAFLLAFFVSIAAAFVKLYLLPTETFQVFLSNAALIWAASQIFFICFIQLFKLDVNYTHA